MPSRLLILILNKAIKKIKHNDILHYFFLLFKVRRRSELDEIDIE